MDLHRRRWLWCVGRYLRGRAAARSKRSARATSSTPPPTSGTGTAPPGHFMTHLSITEAVPRRPAPGSRLGRARHRRRIQPALIRNVTVSGPAADGDRGRAQSEGVLVRPPSYDTQRHITTGSASFSASFMRPVQPTRTAGTRAASVRGPVTYCEAPRGRSAESRRVVPTPRASQAAAPRCASSRYFFRAAVAV